MYLSAIKTKAPSALGILPQDAWELIATHSKHNNLVILDVSTPAEFEGLHLEGAVNVSLLSRFFKARLDVMDRSKVYIVYCKVGGRSKVAQKLMLGIGFKKVYNLNGGTLLWEEEGLPFASGTEGRAKATFCPFFMSFVILKKVKRALRTLFARFTPLNRQPYN